MSKDGFLVKPDGSISWHSSPPPHNRSKGYRWVPWDEGQAEWREKYATQHEQYGGGVPLGQGPGGSVPGIPGGPGQSTLEKNSGGTSSWPTGSGGGGIGEWLKDNYKWLVPAAAGAWNTYRTSQRQGKGDELSEEAVALARQRWEETAPLRAQFMEGIGQMPSKGPDLTGVFDDPGNPWNRAAHKAAPDPGIPGVQPPGPGGGGLPPITGGLPPGGPTVQPPGDDGSSQLPPNEMAALMRALRAARMRTA